jgi:hypothetical protein
MRKIRIIFITILSLALFAIVSLLSLTVILAQSASIDNQGKFKYVQNEAFGFGEKLEYKVGYKFITAGTGHIFIRPEPVYRAGRKCYDVQFLAQSLPSLEWIYKVRDEYRSIIDVGGLFSWQFEQHIRESKYRRDEMAEFDQINNIAKVGDKTYKVPPQIHDVISAFYFVRSLDLGKMKKDSIFYLQNFYKDTVYNLGVKIHGKQVVEVDAGKFRCVVVEPLVVAGGMFKWEGHLLIWLTDDDRRIPVKVATKILIGYVSADLISYKGVRGPIAAKLNQ